jgi:hypothetical protein
MPFENATSSKINQLPYTYLTTHTSLSPIWRGFVPGFVNYKKGCIRLAAASDKVYQLLGSLWILWLLPSLKLVAMI